MTDFTDEQLEAVQRGEARLPYATAMELFKYDPITGELSWRKTTNSRAPAGKIIKTRNSSGYLVVIVKRRQYRVHRICWLIHYGEWPPEEIDHINHVRDDNRLVNLRAVPRGGNHKNRTLQKNNKTGIPGVMYSQNKNAPGRDWIARIIVKGKQHHLGHFDSFFNACCARKSAEIKNGFHPNHGAQKP